MRKLPALALVVLACWTPGARAVEFKNVRATYGPFGATRPNNQMLPGDFFFLSFDVAGLKVDATGIAKYEITLEAFDTKGKSVFKESNPKGVILALGGNSIPELARVMLGEDQPPGKYKMVVTILENGAKTPNQLVQDIELLPRGFGFIFVVAPAVGISGQDCPMGLSVVGMTRDPKKGPKLTSTMRVIDEATGKPTLAEPMVSKFPDDVPEKSRESALKENLVRLDSPIYLNRPGRFKVEVEVRDELSKKSQKFSYSFHVLDAAGK